MKHSITFVAIGVITGLAIGFFYYSSGMDYAILLALSAILIFGSVTYLPLKIYVSKEGDYFLIEDSGGK